MSNSEKPFAITRRTFAGAIGIGGSALAAFAPAQVATSQEPGRGKFNTQKGEHVTDEILKEKIRRARLAGPKTVTDDATVAEMDAQGNLVVLQQGNNNWICLPGNENIIGDVPMALDPMGMQWFKDIRARKPKPTNTSPGLIYMLCGATQRSLTDPFDSTSPPIPIGPHWMILWPFEAKAAGLGTRMRDAGAMVMFAGTPWAHLHICGSPWDGNEYHPGDRAIRTLTYARP